MDIWLAIAVGIALIAVLLWYIRTQLKRIADHKARHENDITQKKDSQRLNIYDSLEVIATVMLDDQVELAEGCIRIKVLLDNLEPSLNQQAEFQIFAQIYDKTAHMPTHQARKTADKRDIRKFDAERERLEEEHREAIRAAATRLLQWLQQQSRPN